jgi:hypothetical protein
VNRSDRGRALAALLGDILDMSMLIPHGACLLWKPELIWLNAISDAMVACAFFTSLTSLSTDCQFVENE